MNGGSIRSTKIVSFFDLKAWQEGHKLVLCVYGLIKSFPPEERFSLSDQLRRSAISVTSNIAEGFGRRTGKEKLHFYYQSNGSLLELKSQLMIARDLRYISSETFKGAMDIADHAHALLRGLMKSAFSVHP
ncbi:MAG: four helix bundle protein [Patescibacteria group bacterium]|nr:four helix bundle protein [Patescibacteria group bacterium]